MTEQTPIQYDRRADALTITLSDRPVARTVDLHDGRLVDVDTDGHVVAIEVLGASAGFTLTDLADDFERFPGLAEALRGIPPDGGGA